MQNRRQLPFYDEYLEVCEESPVIKKIKGKSFVSRSKGLRNGKRRPRKEEKPIILLKYGDTGFKFYDGGDTNMAGRIPFDQWATEIYGEMFCQSIDRHADDYLRDEIKDLLDRKKGRF